MVVVITFTLVKHNGLVDWIQKGLRENTTDRVMPQVVSLPLSKASVFMEPDGCNLTVHKLCNMAHHCSGKPKHLSDKYFAYWISYKSSTVRTVILFTIQISITKVIIQNSRHVVRLQ
jgi:hypothetical protein